MDYQNNLKKLKIPHYLVPHTIITSSSSKKISLFTIDSSLIFEAHISQLSKTCCAHIHDLHCLCLDIKTNSAIAILIVHSKLHYCISFHNLPKTSIFKLQLNQNAFIRTVTKSPKFWHISPLLKSPHWLISQMQNRKFKNSRAENKMLFLNILYIRNVTP